MVISFEDLNFGDLEHAKEEYCKNGFVKFSRLITPELAEDLYKTIFQENARDLRRKDFEMAQSYGTPRNMSVLGGDVLNKIKPIRYLYYNPHFIKVLDDITTDAESCPEEEVHVITFDKTEKNRREMVVATELHNEGDTHGKHFDDPALALIFCLKAAPPGYGGELIYYCTKGTGGGGGYQWAHSSKCW